MKTENEINEIINEKFRIHNGGFDSDFFIDEYLNSESVCLNVHVGVLNWMNENIEPHKEMFKNVCAFIFETFDSINLIYSPFGDVNRKNWAK